MPNFSSKIPEPLNLEKSNSSGGFFERSSSKSPDEKIPKLTDLDNLGPKFFNPSQPRDLLNRERARKWSESSSSNSSHVSRWRLKLQHDLNRARFLEDEKTEDENSDDEMIDDDLESYIPLKYRLEESSNARHIRHDITWHTTEISKLSLNLPNFLQQPSLRCLDCHSIILKDIQHLKWCYPSSTGVTLKHEKREYKKDDKFVEHISLKLSHCALLNFRDNKSYDTFAFQYYPIAKWWKRETLKFTDGSMHSHLPDNILPPGLDLRAISSKLNQKLHLDSF